MKKSILGFLLIHLVTRFNAQQDSVIITANYPITVSKISLKTIQQNNLGKDIPSLLEQTPSLITTSDAGNQVGYTTLRIRGIDQSRINVTLNDIPVNDAESQQVYWVDLPDLASSLQSITIQRGIGSSTQGSAAFGGSILLNTHSKNFENNAFVSWASSYGSFQTSKNTLVFNSQNRIKNININGRISYLRSTGYIDRAKSQLKSYALESSWKNWTLNTFGGYEKTYQAWYGVNQNRLSQNRTYNPAGEIYDEQGALWGYYDNQQDTYRQHYYQLHYRKDKNTWQTHYALFYTFGKGNYEEYINQANLVDYFPQQIAIVDLIRQKWLRNHFYGFIAQLQKKISLLTWDFGGQWTQYRGMHWGTVIDYPKLINMTLPQEIFYDNKAIKSEIASYQKLSFNLKNWKPYWDLQVRYIKYQTKAILLNKQEDFSEINQSLFFLNPKIGLSYQTQKKQRLGFLYAYAQREPSRQDYMQIPTVKPEKMHNLELLHHWRNEKINLKTTLYGMWFKNQLILSGMIDNTGTPLRQSKGKSYRIGIELEGIYHFTKKIVLQTTASFSRNINQNYIEEIPTAIGFELKNLGNTKTAYAPSIILGASLEYHISPYINLNWQQKYISSQYRSNANYPASKLDAYAISNLLLQYKLPISGIKSQVQFALYNLLNQEYESNGYYYNYYDGNAQDAQGLNHNPYYYPQAGINFMLGFQVQF